MRQVLIPGTRKAFPHPGRIAMMVARGDIEDRPAIIEEEYAKQQQRVAYQISRKKPRIRRYSSGGTPYRSPSRTNRLRKSGRLRKELL